MSEVASEIHDLVIECETIITVDSARRILEKSWIAIDKDRISALGQGPAPAGRKHLARPHMIALPGLIDAHAHAGHGLVRAAGDGNGAVWFDVCETLYACHATPEFWYAEARLAQLERVMGGVTTAASLLGGGADVMRTDSLDAGEAHCRATRESGLRTLLAVGPSRHPFPKPYARRDKQGNLERFDLAFETQLEVSADLIRSQNDILKRRTGVCLVAPVYTQAHLNIHGSEIRALCDKVSVLREALGVIFMQDGHRAGSIDTAKSLGQLGPWAALAHCVDLTPDDIIALQATGASVIHNPSSIMSILGRCPVPELLDLDVTVALGSDAAAPDRGYDMFRHMAQCMHYHRRHFREPAIMTEGKTLELATIGAARALGLDSDLGSLEVGKKADIILLDGFKPHLYPPVMHLNRITHFSSAADVDTVIVDGTILMEQRHPKLVSPPEILEQASEISERLFKEANLTGNRNEKPDIWHIRREASAGFRAAGSEKD
jgi:5-methylthioadenosine/S-adenosylhomocysteine deaminase